MTFLATRRGIIAGIAAAPAILRAQTLFADYPFRLGVASGDPAPDGFVIWTRLAPDPLVAHGGMPMAPVDVAWEIGSDDSMRTIVKSGTAAARPELGHSVHVEVGGLEPGRPYWYRFKAGAERTFIGRAQTLPAPGSSPGSVRLGVVGCQNYEDGLYTAYRHLSAETLDCVFHYGDYIYEGRSAPTPIGYDGKMKPFVRAHAGGKLYSLDDYRRRYAQTKLDADLQAAHAAAPWFMTFDDHEVENNWVSEIDSEGAPSEVFALRRAGAFQAWYEHMPVRQALFPKATGIQLYRRARFGTLLDLNLLDTRQFRTDQPCDDGFKPECPGVADATASILGAGQEAWLDKGLRDRSTRWTVLAQQIMMMKLDRRTRGEPAPIRNMDSWAGYDAPRERLFAKLKGRGDMIVLTGDEHQNFAGELRTRGGTGDAVAVEFVSTSISSGGSGQDVRAGSDKILAENPFLKFINDQRGYLVCEATPDVWTTNIRVIDKVHEPGGVISTRQTIAVERGRVALNLS